MKITIEIPDDQIKLVNGKPLLDWRLFDSSQNILPNTWEEFCDNNLIQCKECYINGDSEITKADDIKIYGDERVSCYYNLLPSREAAEAHLALIKLHQLRDCYRQGWIPNYNSDIEIKYSIYRNDNDLFITKVHNRYHFLAFQSKELAEKFIKNFRNLIIKVGDLI